VALPFLSLQRSRCLGPASSVWRCGFAASDRHEEAIRLDPRYALAYAKLSDAPVTLASNFSGSIATREGGAEGDEVQPQAATSYAQLAIIQILRGKSGAAVEFAKKETDPFWRTYALALAHFANGDRAEADAALKKLIDENADSGASQIAQVYALRKEPDKMFEWLEHGWPTNDPGVAELLGDPFLRAYKDDPRFIAFAQKIGVMPK
jgi:serine/threonine-protein kinase